MDSASLESLTPLLDGIDRWVELAPLLPVIISLELVLSADNAIALASITRRLKNIKAQSTALNFGIILSLFLRLILILLSQLILKLWPIRLIAGIYLIGLFINKILEIRSKEVTDSKEIQNKNDNSISLIRVIIFLGLTDLAFSIDSIAAAVAISDQFLLVVTGALIGVIALRFTSGIFISLLEEYSRLETAGYIAVGFVGLKLIISLLMPNAHLPEWSVFILMISLFIWGFSKKEGSVTLPE